MKHDFKELLRSHELKVTAARMGVLECLSQAAKPTDVADIMDYFARNSQGVDQATVYRVLRNLVTIGLVHAIELQEGKSRYELASQPHHHHAVCVRCGSIQDIDDCGATEMESVVTEKLNFQIQSHSLEFFGICAKCRYAPSSTT